MQPPLTARAARFLHHAGIQHTYAPTLGQRRHLHSVLLQQAPTAATARLSASASTGPHPRPSPNPRPWRAPPFRVESILAQHAVAMSASDPRHCRSRVVAPRPPVPALDPANGPETARVELPNLRYMERVPYRNQHIAWSR